MRLDRNSGKERPVFQRQRGFLARVRHLGPAAAGRICLYKPCVAISRPKLPPRASDTMCRPPPPAPPSRPRTGSPLIETGVIAMPGSRIPLVVETEGRATSQPIGLVELSSSGTTPRRTGDFLPRNGRSAQLILASRPKRCQAENGTGRQQSLPDLLPNSVAPAGTMRDGERLTTPKLQSDSGVSGHAETERDTPGVE